MAEAQTVVQFLLWENPTGGHADLFFAKVAPKTFATGTLKELRTAALATSTQHKIYVSYSFCSNRGSIVSDNWTVKDYLSVAGTDPDAPTNTISFFLTKPRLSPSLAQAVQTIPPHTNATRSLAKLTDTPTSSYDSADYEAQASTSSTYVTDLGEREWAIVFRNNLILNGFSFDRQTSGNVTTLTGVSPAPKSAFVLKSREIDSQLLSPEQVGSKVVVAIPNYVVDDQSYVECYETTSSLQTAMANSSFSSVDVSASINGGACGYSVGVSASYSQSGQSSASQTRSDNEHSMHISYNFPRVLLNMDRDTLALSDVCKSAIVQIGADATPAQIADFFNTYGELYPMRVQLGGRLFASESSSTVAGTTDSDRAKTMKASASVSVAGSYVSGSVSASYAQSNEQKASASQSSSSTNLNWQANGGDTLLCNNPAAWCATVGSFHNWRTTRQDKVLHLMDAILAIDNDPALRTIATAWSQKDPLAANSSVASSSQYRFESVSSWFMTVYSPMSRSAYEFASNLASNNKLEKDWGFVSRISNFAENNNEGGLNLNTAYADNAVHGQNFVFLDGQSNLVSQPRYDTKYFITNPSTGLFASAYRADAVIFPKASANFKPAIVLRNPDGSRDGNPIKINSQVWMEIFLNWNDNKATFSYSYEEIAVGGKVVKYVGCKTGDGNKITFNVRTAV